MRVAASTRALVTGAGRGIGRALAEAVAPKVVDRLLRRLRGISAAPRRR